MPSLDSPTNCITEYEDKLAQLVASCDSFRTFAGLPPSANTSDRVFLHAMPDPEDGEAYSESEWLDINPSCLIIPPEDGVNFAANLTASVAGFTPGYSYELVFQQIPAREVSLQQQIRKLINGVGSVVEEMLARYRSVGVGVDFLGPVSAPSSYKVTVPVADYEYTISWSWQVRYRFVE